MFNNSQYTIIIQYLSILGVSDPVPTPMSRVSRKYFFTLVTVYTYILFSILVFIHYSAA